MTTRARDPSRWLRQFHSSPGTHHAPRLVCLPHAGGSASSFYWLSQELSSSVEVFVAQYPGRQDRLREIPVESLDEIVRSLCGELREWCDRPFALFGHSMGAVLAFETAYRLYDEHRLVPMHVIVSGQRAPSRHRTECWDYTDESMLAALRALGTDERLLENETLLRMIVPAVRADLRAMEGYRPRPNSVLTCPITAFVGDSDPDTTVEEVRAWSEHTSGRFELRIFSGGHFYLGEEPPGVAGALRMTLLPDATTA